MNAPYLTAAPGAILYSFRRCPYAMRARMALHASKLAYEHREILLRDKPAAMLAVSPKGTVPVLVLRESDGAEAASDAGAGLGARAASNTAAPPGVRVLDESLDIMRYALAQADPEDWLSGDCAVGRALIDENDGAFKKALDRYKYHERHPEKPQQGHRADGCVFLERLEAALAKHEGLGLVAARATLPDIAIFPFVRQFARVDLDWFGAAPFPRLRAWLARHEAGARFAEIMRKRPLWQAC